MIHVTGMLGLGDNVYQRAVVREMGDVQLTTPWPQLYADLPGVRCVPASTTLRTQAKNIARWDWQGAATPTGPARRLGYSGKSGTIIQCLLDSAGLGRLPKLTFDLPRFPAALADRKYVVVRPVTMRAEWPAASRNPRTEYMTQAAQAARAAGYVVVAVADLEDGKEWLADGCAPPYDVAHLRGELPLEKLFALVAGASGVVGGVGWLLPAALAYRVPMLLIYGGWGTLNGPQRLLDPRIDSSRVVQAIPDPFCMCDDKDHRCSRTINLFEEYINEFVRQIHRP